MSIADSCINSRIAAADFMQRQRDRGHYVDLQATSEATQTIVFKQGFANTPYFAQKKLLEECARAFRDLPHLPYIIVVIPLGDETYAATVPQYKLEDFLGVSFAELHKDITLWRAMLGKINKAAVLDFAKRFVTYTPSGKG